MPKKDDRVIKSGIRFGRKVYMPGDEDDLAEVLTEEDASRLVESGALEGNWTGKAKAAAKPEPAKPEVKK